VTDPNENLTALIAQLRAGGVMHAEFHPDGSVKVLTLGPESNEPPTTEDGEAEPDPKVHPLKEAARRLAFGTPRTRDA
jgi:hypothetical protein